jgi:phosphoribosylamine---glycine ligase
MSRLVMPTRILIVGSGGREHALAWKLGSEPGVNEIVVMIGRHPVTAEPRVRMDGGNPNSPSKVVEVAKSRAIELVVIGPEGPLAAGVGDALIEAGIPVFGPPAAAARIETSKSFCREVAVSAGVPMAEGKTFDDDDRDAGREYATRMADRGGVVIKADGLAAGKGVTVCDTADEAAEAIERIEGRFVVEERLSGREASVIAICDGRDAVALPISRDYKRLGDGDKGPNTGGMGAYSPLMDLPDDAADEILEQFHQPVLAELARRGTPFRGALYAGLMLTGAGPRLLEFNARLGDPETQVILPRLAVPLGPLLLAAARGSLREADGLVDGRSSLATLPGAVVGIVLAGAGYPQAPEPGSRITALDDDGQLPDAPGVHIFHSGTFHETPGVFQANGGRIVTVVGRGPDLAAARSVAEQAADRIGWPGHQRRHDIGVEPALAPTVAPAGAGR